MSEDHIISPAVASFSTLSVSDTYTSDFGYDPAIGTVSNAITSESSNVLLNKKSINLTPTSHDSIYDRNINNKKVHEINLSSFSFLFLEIVSLSYKNSKGIQDLETRLNGLGYQVGQRYLELIKLREGLKHSKREVKIIEVLQFIHGTFWRSIFGKTANELEKSQDVSNEYMIVDNIPMVSRFISIPKDYGNLNCSAFVAGIIEGALDSSSFHAVVTAHSDPFEKYPLRTVFLIKFDDLLLKREEIRFE